jgi:hypothetical protein
VVLGLHKGSDFFCSVEEIAAEEREREREREHPNQNQLD